MTRPKSLRAVSRILGVRVVRGTRWPVNPLGRRPYDRLLPWLVKAPVRATRWLFWIFAAILSARQLRDLYLLEKSSARVQAMPEIGAQFGLERCDIRYINLDHRSDRREHFEAEMCRIGVSWHQRVPGVNASPGILGCVLAHIDLLESWDRDRNRLLLVFEDDAQCVVTRDELDAVIEEFAAAPELQVLMLAHNAAWHIPISDRLAVSSDVFTAAAFVLRPEMASKIQAAFQTSVHMLEANLPVHKAALDVVWREVQREEVFAIATPRCVVQRPGYSDIEQQETNYGI